jgi:hypothetical protein
MDDFDNIDVGGGWSPADVSSYFDNNFWSDIGDIDVKYGSIDVPDLSTLPSADYSNEGQNYPTAESTQGGGGSPINASVTGGSGGVTSLKGLFDKLTKTSSGQLDYAKILPLIYGLYGATQSNQRTQPSGYQGGIPRYTATRQAPEPGKRISGNVAFTPKAAGGGLKAGGFIIPADVVSHFGNGSSDAGLKALASKLGATPIKGAGDGMSDSIPTSIDGKEKALVAHEEAYLSPEKVARIGNGDQAKGAKKLRDMMERIRKARTGTTEQGRQIDPNKFMPGGEVKRYVTGGTTGVGAAAAAGVTGTEESLANWAGPYVTDMLAKGQALSEMPFEQYSGPLTAGPSALQTQAFGKAADINTPTAIGNAATTAGNVADAFQNLKYNAVGSDFTAPVAQQYMNPYLSAALNPQMEEMRRQAKINNLQGLGQFTKSGAYGGSRQAIMESEAARNLLAEQNKTLGQGYATAYDKAMAQFNADQQRKVQEAQFGSTLGLQGLQGATQAAQAQGQLGATQQQADLAGLKALAEVGAAQRGIESEATAAEKAQFEEARLNPYKMVQFQQSLLSGLPLAATTYNQTPTNNLTQFAGNLTTLQNALKSLGITPG